MHHGSHAASEKSDLDCSEANIVPRSEGLPQASELSVTEVREIRIEKGRAAKEDMEANDGEINGMRAVCGSLLWAAREGRPDIAGEVNILSGTLPKPKIGDLKKANQTVRHLHATPNVIIQVRPIPLDRIVGITITDASLNNAKDGKSQLAYLVGFADKAVLDGHPAEMSVLGWKSKASPRVCNSTLMSEAYSLTYGLAAYEWLTSAWHLSLDYQYRLPERDERNKVIKVQSLMRYPEDEKILMLGVTDAKSLYDNLVRESTSQNEKRAGLEVCVARESLDALGGRARWLPHEQNIVDTMTKINGNRARMLEFLRKASLSLKAENDEMAERKAYREETGQRNPRPRVQHDRHQDEDELPAAHEPLLGF